MQRDLSHPCVLPPLDKHAGRDDLACCVISGWQFEHKTRPDSFRALGLGEDETCWGGHSLLSPCLPPWACRHAVRQPGLAFGAG